LRLNPNLKDFWKSKGRYKVLFGGRASSKTYDTCLFLLIFTNQVKVRVLSTRQIQAKISDSVYTVLKSIIYNNNHFKTRFRVYENKIVNIYTKSEFIFYGLANERSLLEIKGMEIDICFSEESESLTKQQFDIINPTLRSSGSFWIILFNPRYKEDFIYQKFVINPPGDSVVKKINYPENPFLSDTILKVIEEEKQTDFESYQHIYLGIPKESNENVTIPRAWIEASIDFNLPMDNKIIGYDVSVSGKNDPSAFVCRAGNKVIDIFEMKLEQIQATREVFNYAIINKVQQIVFDSIGVGEGANTELIHLQNQFKEKVLVTPCNVGESAKDDYIEYSNKKAKELFQNFKAQLWWEMRLRFKRTYETKQGIKEHDKDLLISLPSKNNYLEKLVSELSTPSYFYTSSNKIQIESKKDLAKKGIASTNLADALILSYGGFRLLDYNKLLY